MLDELCDGSLHSILFHVEHVKTMHLRKEEFDDLLSLPDAYDRIERMAACGEALSVIDGGKVITCAGFVQVWPGLLEMWQIPSVHLSEKPMRYSRFLKRYLETLARQLKCHRVQTTCLDDVLHHKWMEFLEFEREGTLRKYSYTQQNYKQWARLFTWQ